MLLLFGDLLKDFHVHVIFATDKAIAARPAALRSFLAGWFETIAFMRKDKAKTLEIAQGIMQTDAPTTERIYDAMMPMFNDDGHFKPKALAVLAHSFVDMKTLPNEPDMKTLINESFLPKNKGRYLEMTMNKATGSLHLSHRERSEARQRARVRG